MRRFSFAFWQVWVWVWVFDGVFWFSLSFGSIFVAMQELRACRGEFILVYPEYGLEWCLIQIITRVYDDPPTVHTHQTSIFGQYYNFDTYG